MKILLLFAALSSLIFNVNSLKCYQCTNKNNLACGDPFNDFDSLKECPSLYGIEPKMCRKLRQTVDTPAGKIVRVTRNCGYLNDSQPVRDRSCFRASFTAGSSSKYCSCTDDSCNASEKIRKNSFLVTTLLIAIYVLVNF